MQETKPSVDFFNIAMEKFIERKHKKEEKTCIMGFSVKT